MRRSIAAALVLAWLGGCGADPIAAPGADAGAGAGPGDGDGAPATPDDLEPYDLPADCAGKPTWAIEPLEPTSLVGFGTEEVWMVTGAFIGQPGTLRRARAGEGAFSVVREGVNQVWACAPDDLWAVGAGGLVLHWDGEELAEVPPPAAVDLESGVGCDGAVWVVGGGRLFHLAGRTWTEQRFEVVDWPSFLEADPVPGHRLYRTGDTLAVLTYYGHAFVGRPDGRFQYVGLTDDINSDLFLRHDRTGLTMHGGYTLLFDGRLADPPHEEGPIPAVSVSRRSDDDAWLVGPSVHHWDGTAYRPVGDLVTRAIDARATSVWTGGHGLLAYRTVDDWCVLEAPADPGG